MRVIKGSISILLGSMTWLSGATFRTLLIGMLGGMACLFCPHAQAQTYLQSIGVPTFTTKAPVENGFVNLANGNLHIEIPIGSYPQRGGSTDRVVLTYDSAIWEWMSNGSSWEPDNATSSWTWKSSRDRGTIYYGTDYETDGFCFWFNFYSFVYTSPDGTAHTFSDMPTMGYSCEQNCAAVTKGAYSDDGTGLWLYSDNCGNAMVVMPDGTQTDGSAEGYIEDSNGNEVGPAPCGGGATADTVGRTPLWYAYPGTFTIPNSQGGITVTCSGYSSLTGSTFTPSYTSVSVNTNFGVSGVSEYSGSVYVLSSLELPDGTSYSFKYDCDSTTSSACGSPTGRSAYYGQLISMTLPTGAQIQYSYTNFTDANGNASPWVNTRTTPDSSTAWSYAPTVDSTCTSGQVDCEQHVTVTKPNGDYNIYTFALNGGAWPIKVQYYDSSATLDGTQTRCWSFVTVTSGSCSYNVSSGYGESDITESSETITLPIPGTSISATTEYTWDTYNNNNVTTVAEWNFGSSLSGNADRTTTITYLNETTYPKNVNILNRPTSVVVTDSSSSLVAKTVYTYDGTSVSSKTGQFLHDDTNYGTGNNVRGNLTEVDQYYDSTHYLSKTMTYDMTGQMTSSTDSNGNSTTFSYTDHYFKDAGDGSAPTSFTPPVSTNAYLYSVTGGSLTSYFGYYWGTGQMALATDPNGQTTYFHFYDSLNRPTSTALPSGGWTLGRYDISSSLETGSELYTGITSTTASTSCTSCRHDQTILDSLGMGRVATQKLVSDPDYSGGTRVDVTYDADGRVKTVSNPYRTTSDSTYGIETPGYDGLDRVKQTQHADGDYAYTSYGSAVGSGVSQSCSSSTYGTGYPVLYTDEVGRKRRTWTDAFGRIIEGDEPDSSGSLTSQTCYRYDLNNNLKYVWSTGGGTQDTLCNTSYARCNSYDLMSRPTSIYAPENGTTTYSYTTSGGAKCSGDPTAVCRRTDVKGITATYTYDSLNRLTSISYSDSTPSVTYYYDQTSYNGLTIANGKGRLTGMSDGSGETAWSYDAVGNVTSEERTIEGITQTISYTYNLDGSPKTVVYPSGRTVTYTTGNAERQTAAEDTGNSIDYATTGQYAPQGALSSLSNGASNILSTIYYNNRLELCRIAVNSSGTAPNQCSDSSDNGNVMDLSYSYAQSSHDDGNITTEANNVSGSSGRSQTYTYDPLNRVLSASAAATSGADCWGQQMGNNGTPPTLADDALDNLLVIASTKCSSPTLNVTVSGGNQISTSGFGYDSSGNGNMTNDAVNTYSYDAENRINTAVGGAYCYIYDGNGLRVAKGTPKAGYTCATTGANAPTMNVLYWRDEDGNTIAETDGSGSTSNSNYHEYVFFAGQRTARSDPSAGNVYYYFTDQLGSTRVLTDSSGSPCYEADFLPYGTENTPAGFSNTCSTNYKFTGYERDAETGNDYAFARYYNQRIARFMSPDPMVMGDITNPQTLNRYTYVRNNPTNLVDPSGLDPCDPDDPSCGVCDPIFGCGGCDPLFDCGCVFYCTGPTLTYASFGGYFPSGVPLDPTANTAFGIPNGLQLPLQDPLALLFPFPIDPTCTFGGGYCGGGIYGFQGPAIPWEAEGIGDALAWLARLLWPITLAKGGPSQNPLPTWVTARPKPGETADQFAKRVCEAKYPPDGAGCGSGPGSEFNKIRKWAQDWINRQPKASPNPNLSPKPKPN